MAIRIEGPPMEGRAADDPPIGFYWLKLRCTYCNAPAGHLWPEANARNKGESFAESRGGAGVCKRCGKSNTSIVESEPPAKPARGPAPWSY